MNQQKITDDLEALIEVLPLPIQKALREADRADELLEVVLDLGRLPEARFLHHEVKLAEKETAREDIQHVVAHIGDFGDDNRAGIERTLHRISAIRNRKGDIVGLTCRVGRAVYGTIDIIRDLVDSGQSVLLLGRPGVGKTTMLREVARVLAETKRVIIVDTSNEIGGDGDIPHPSVGRARRMQVETPPLQHAVMIEAVENHMPEVIVIDEIGTEMEAAAARTIAERGVQLVGTAHGNTLDNLMLNPTLSDLVGGIQSVTLSDEEARRRGTQKSILERMAPPTFDVVIEIQDWQRLAIQRDVASAVDAILRGRPIQTELRYRDEQGEIKVEEAAVPALGLEERPVRMTPQAVKPREMLKVYAYGVGQNRLHQAATNLSVPVRLVEGLRDADVILTLRNYYRKRPQPISDAEARGIPIYVLRSNTVAQMEGCLADIFGVTPAEVEDPFSRAMNETQEAIQRVMGGARTVELHPQAANIRRLQHQAAREANLISFSQGREPRRRVTISRNDGGHR